MKGFGNSNMMQVHGQLPPANMSTMGAPMMSGNPMMSGYQLMGQAQMSQPPQYSMPSPQMPIAYQQGYMSSAQMYPSATAGQSPATMMTPDQTTTFMKRNPGTIPQQQMMPGWPQYQGMPAVSGYPTMYPYAPRPNANSYIVDYSDGLNILDEPTGGTTYMTK